MRLECQNNKASDYDSNKKSHQIRDRPYLFEQDECVMIEYWKNIFSLFLMHCPLLAHLKIFFPTLANAHMSKKQQKQQQKNTFLRILFQSRIVTLYMTTKTRTG